MWPRNYPAGWTSGKAATMTTEHWPLFISSADVNHSKS
jgi:hypothetical protein